MRWLEDLMRETFVACSGGPLPAHAQAWWSIELGQELLGGVVVSKDLRNHVVTVLREGRERTFLLLPAGTFEHVGPDSDMLDRPGGGS